MSTALLSDKIVERASVPPGTGRLVVERSGASSVVRRAEATSPLKWLMPANHGRAAWVFASTYGGGLVGGDAIAYDLHVGAGAAAWVSTQASTKIYRSPRGTSTTVRGRVGEDGLLAIMPDPVVCFAASTYRQTQTFDLDAGGSLICLDWMTSGRHARGERWAFDRYHAALTVRAAGRTICHDAMTLDASDGSLVDRLGRFDVLATVVLAGPAVRDDVPRLLAEAARQPVARRADRWLAVAPLGADGALVRMAGRTTESVGLALRASLSFLPALLGDDPWTRKW